MIASFVDSWALFQHTYLAGWCIGLLLSCIGVLVVARDQIFIGVAVSQASTLGIAVGLTLGGLLGAESAPWVRSDSFLSLLAVLFAILAALLTAQKREGGGESHEAMTGWVFLISASLAVLLVAHSPHGLEEVQRLLSSSLIGATATDVGMFGSLVSITVVVVGITHRRLLLFALDPAMATAVGMRVSLWVSGSAVWLGLAVGLSIRVSGMLYTFGSLILPALVAKNLCREVRSVFLLAPLIAVGGGILGFVCANHYDYPPGPMTVALLSFMLIVAWVLRHLRDGTRGHRL